MRACLVDAKGSQGCRGHRISKGLCFRGAASDTGNGEVCATRFLRNVIDGRLGKKFAA